MNGEAKKSVDQPRNKAGSVPEVPDKSYPLRQCSDVNSAPLSSSTAAEAYPGGMKQMSPFLKEDSACQYSPVRYRDAMLVPLYCCMGSSVALGCESTNKPTSRHLYINSTIPCMFTKKQFPLMGLSPPSVHRIAVYIFFYMVLSLFF